jgi:hypothetical protein
MLGNLIRLLSLICGLPLRFAPLPHIRAASAFGGLFVGSQY